MCGLLSETLNSIQSASCCMIASIYSVWPYYTDYYTDLLTALLVAHTTHKSENFLHISTVNLARNQVHANNTAVILNQFQCHIKCCDSYTTRYI